MSVSRSKALYLLPLLAVTVLLSLLPVNADEIHTIGTFVVMPTENYYGPGPQTFGPGITWSSTNASTGGGSVFGYTGTYSFGENGYWDYLPYIGPMAGLNDSTGTMTFAFASPVAAVDGFVNYVPFTGNPTTIAVYDSTHTLIESYNLSFLYPNGVDNGSFVGFSEPTSDISYFTLTGNYVGITRMSFLSEPIMTPEPGVVLMLLVGVLGLAVLRLRRKPVAAIARLP